MYLDRLEFKNDILIGIDPRCRIGAGVCLIAAVIHCSNPWLLAGIILGLFLCLIKDIRTVLLRLIPVNLMVLFLWLTLPLGVLTTGAGMTGGFGETGGGALGGALRRALIYTLRINAAALIYMGTIIPLGAGGLANALIKLRCPDKLISLFLLTYRYIFVMYERIFGAVRSLAIRRPRQNTLGRWASYTAVFSTALVSAFQRSWKISRAMQIRGFNGVIPLTRSFSWKKGDTLFFVFCLLLSSALWILNGALTGGSWNF
ncbi:MAG: energy-coupling factor transporter transmembrane protein EcfT [Spirochaetaceae bacterium]|jgi:cobalt/nickel transport system permease protein|nr:energy-coupling factor transporter transmembrane protein EcfT [Spirochaetaceae bacterium]